MRITCIGGGPGGLYAAIATKRLDPAHEVRVVERRPSSVTHGWGIVYWDDLLAGVRGVDPATARAIRAGSVPWTGQRVCVGDARPVHLGGTGYGMERRLLIDVLVGRARELGVRVDVGTEVDDLDAAAAGSDLVVLSDGAHSRLRRSRAGVFGTTETGGGNKHIWLGSGMAFSDFTFAFESTPAGWIWLHAYSYGADGSTVIAECAESTWRGLGLDTMDDAAGRALLEEVFARHLGGHRLRNRPEAPATWSTFPRISNQRWSDGNVVLLGDCAHTAHFSIGSGTRLAFEDAAALGRALAGRTVADLPTALQAYQDERMPVVAALQRDAERSARWFEQIDEHLDDDLLQFGYALRMRRIPGAADRRSSLHYRLHQATQWPLGRSARRVVADGRRVLRTHRVAAPRG
ncbi:FAD-dependent monooxygenase [Blastococcus sp. SYSU D00820]